MSGLKATPDSLCPDGFSGSAEERDRYSAVVATCSSLVAGLQGVEFLWHEPLARHTTFRLGGPAACLARPQTEDALRALIEVVAEHRIPHIVLGGGSNILAPDGLLPVLVIQLTGCRCDPSISGSGSGGGVPVHSGAGTMLSRFLGFCLRNDLGGLEYLVGIPGTVGGALVMNAGTGEGTVSDSLDWIELLDPEGLRHRLPGSELRAGYRDMGLPRDWVVLGGCFRLQRSSGRFLRARMRDLMTKRRSTQPLGLASAGCIFRNPPEAPAGELIEKSGLKKLRIGGAEISGKHANWVINLGSAKSGDVLALIRHVENEVFRNFGVRLEREIRILTP